MFQENEDLRRWLREIFSGEDTSFPKPKEEGHQRQTKGIQPNCEGTGLSRQGKRPRDLDDKPRLA